MSAIATNQPRAARFWNRIAKKYARDPVGDQASYEYKLDQTAKRLRPDMEVLEFGCGTGTTALIHGPRVAHIDATDFSSAMIDIARGKAAAEGADNVSFHVSSIEDWPMPPDGEAYDVVMAHSILHLVTDLDAVLAHARNCLKPGGLLVSSTVCLANMSGFLVWVLPKIAWTGLVPRLLCLKGSDLIERMEAAGFTIEEEWRPTSGTTIFLIASAP